MAKKKSKIVYQYLHEMTLAQGLEFINESRKQDSLSILGQKIKRDRARFEVLRTKQLKCFQCGRRATHFVFCKHKNDRAWPFSLNLFAGAVLMTWDHIVPQSLGGGDKPENGRIACARCNENRGNKMSMSDLLWVLKQNPNLIYASEPYEVPKQILGILGNAIKQAKEAVPEFKLPISESCDIIESDTSQLSTGVSNDSNFSSDGMER